MAVCPSILNSLCSYCPSIRVMVILVDSSSNQPMDALDSLRVLEESGVTEQLAASTGLQVTSLEAQEAGPRPEEPDNEEQGGTN